MPSRVTTCCSFPTVEMKWQACSSEHGATISSANVSKLKPAWSFKLTGPGAAGVDGAGSLAAYVALCEVQGFPPPNVLIG